MKYVLKDEHSQQELLKISQKLRHGGWLVLDWWLGEFNKEVQKRAKRIDPSDEMDWYSLTLGWAIAKGMTPILAHDFARFVRYNTTLG